jgi:hypothetical protein
MALVDISNRTELVAPAVIWTETVSARYPRDDTRIW